MSRHASRHNNRHFLLMIFSPFHVALVGLHHTLALRAETYALLERERVMHFDPIMLTLLRHTPSRLLDMTVVSRTQ